MDNICSPRPAVLGSGTVGVRCQGVAVAVWRNAKVPDVGRRGDGHGNGNGGAHSGYIKDKSAPRNGF